MLVFDKTFVDRILTGQKTVTRRNWKRPRVKPGSEQTLMWCYRKDGIFAKARILRVSQEKLGEMTEDDALKEGFPSLDEFKSYWTKRVGSWTPEVSLWVINFALSSTSGGLHNSHHLPHGRNEVNLSSRGSILRPKT